MPGALVPFNRGKIKIVRRTSRKFPKVTPAEESYFNSALVIDMVREIATRDFEDPQKRKLTSEAKKLLRLLERFEESDGFEGEVAAAQMIDAKKDEVANNTRRRLEYCVDYMIARVRRLVSGDKISRIDYITSLLALYDQKNLF